MPAGGPKAMRLNYFKVRSFSLTSELRCGLPETRYRHLSPKDILLGSFSLSRSILRALKVACTYNTEVPRRLSD